MRVMTSLAMTLAGILAGSAVAQQTVPATPRAGGEPYGDFRQGTVIFDQGPLTGTNNGCWWNQTDDQNFADQATFADAAEITEILVFTCVAPLAGPVHVKILSDDGAGNPAAVVYAEDKVADAWAADPDSGGYLVSVVLTTPFSAPAGATYWYGISYNGGDMGQYSVATPGDGTMAQFFASAFQFHAPIGDQMFQLVGTVVPVELQSFDVE